MSSLSSLPANSLESYSRVTMLADINTPQSLHFDETTIVKDVNAGNDVYLDRSKAMKGVQSEKGMIFAFDSQIEGICQAWAGEVRLRNSRAPIVRALIVNWVNPSKTPTKSQAKEIHAIRDIALENVDIVSCHSNEGMIAARGCNFEDVQGWNGVDLTNCFVKKSVQSRLGGVSISNDELEKSIKVRAKKNVFLKNVQFEETHSEEGTVHAQLCRGVRIEAGNSIVLRDSFVISLKCRGPISLTSVQSASEITSEDSTVWAKNSNLQTLTANGKLELIDSVAIKALLLIIPGQEGVVDIKNSSLGRVVVQVIERPSSQTTGSSASSEPPYKPRLRIVGGGVVKEVLFKNISGQACEGIVERE